MSLPGPVAPPGTRFVAKDEKATKRALFVLMDALPLPAFPMDPSLLSETSPVIGVQFEGVVTQVDRE